MHRMRSIRPAIVPVALGVMLLAAWAQPGDARQEGPKPGIVSGTLPSGYLPRTSLPNSLTLLPPPPAAGSAAFARDEAAWASVQALRGSARWNRAATDAVLSVPAVTNNFSCAAGVAINQANTPRLYGLLGKMMVDVGLSTYAAKDHYNRIRPFVVHDETTCTPGEDAALSKDGSYPSGHSAIGWGMALALTEIDPERTDALLQRGRDFGESRLVCDAHWQSDIDAGRVIAAATIARLHADPAFKADLDAARTEVQNARQAGGLPGSDCAAEAASLAAGPV